jgi:NitT/TauT family transport system substrate-binding protein
MIRNAAWLIVLLVSLLSLGAGRSALAAEGEASKVKIALNWVPEPEFGGIYAAEQTGAFKTNGLEVQIQPGGAGAPTWQMVAAGNVQFAIASGDEVVIARSQGADIVTLFATYQTCPQGIMVHEERGLKSLAEVFNGGTLAIEKGLPYTRFLEKKYGFGKVKLVAYDGGIAQFMADPNYAQQCFVTSEPIAARKAGAKVQVFLVADSGYNPYTAVLIARGDYVKKNPQVAGAMVKSLRAGWEAYLKDPKPANEAMGGLNRTMDAQTFAAAAEAQKPLIERAQTDGGIGSMTLQRWQDLVRQLRELKVIEEDVPAESCFVQNP